jgi:class 3 adenylate cyclase
MSEVLARIQALASRGEVRVSAHAYDELADDAILFGDVLASLDAAIAIEDYPEFTK